jgi:hypothetical protein
VKASVIAAGGATPHPAPLDYTLAIRTSAVPADPDVADLAVELVEHHARLITAPALRLCY